MTLELWIESYAQMLGCEPRPSAVAVAIQEKLNEIESARKAIPRARKAVRSAIELEACRRIENAANVLDQIELPPDLQDAFDMMRLALLHHKIAGWRQISQEAALQVIDALTAAVKRVEIADDSDDGSPSEFVREQLAEKLTTPSVQTTDARAEGGGN